VSAERATFRLKPKAFQPAVKFRVHRTKRLEAAIEANPQHSRMASRWKNAQFTQEKIERVEQERRSDCGEHRSNALIRHVADESYRYVHVLGRDPFPRRPATKLQAQLTGRRDRGLTTPRVEFNRNEQTHRISV